MIIDEDVYTDYLMHIGTPRHSGRYPWGSGGEPVHSTDWLRMVADLKKQGLSDAEIYKGMNISSGQFRARKTLARAHQKQEMVAKALALHDKGMGSTAAARQMGIPEATYRTLIAPGADDKARILLATADTLRREVAAKKYIDVGEGNENHLMISKTKLNAAITQLREEGYAYHIIPSPQLTNGKTTYRKVLAPPGTEWGEIARNRDQIQLISRVSGDGGRTFDRKDHPFVSIHPDRVKVRYAEEGGEDADGVIYVRPGVPDLSLGHNHYAQVRIKVGDSHYLKGMAIYKHDLPDGVDLEFNTNKSRAEAPNKLDAMKPIKDDLTGLPFGSLVRQIKEHPGTDKERVVSAMNIVNEDADWKKWGRNISAQALSKQAPSLAREQLAKTYAARKSDYDEIMSLTNPTVKRKLLESFAEGTDRSAVHLKAAALDRQNWHVILPIGSLKPTEIYAPNYNDGERVVLIRYPHGGKFEIPELVVNNKNREARASLGDVKTAVGIHSSVAKHLSGADFDGDTVLVIPNNHNKIKRAPPLEGIADFDAKRLFRLPEGEKFHGNTQHLMGDVSNLITDMTLKGAPQSDIARAVKHSMVVIDAEKHDLDHRRSADTFGIRELKRKYQDGPYYGASTLISRAKSRTDVLDRAPRKHKDGGPIDQTTGELVFVETGRKRADGKDVKIKSKKLAETTDAHSLVSTSNTPMERLYAEHSNRLKDLANQARLSLINTPRLKYSESANKAYANEVASLKTKLDTALRNSPRERHAQAIAHQLYRAQLQAYPNMDNKTKKKVKSMALEDARDRMDAKKKMVEITPDEWKAIQAGAISDSMLERILTNTKIDEVRMLATPHPELVMTSAKTSRARAMLAAGATRAEVAKQLGVSLTTLDRHTIGDDEEDGQ